MSSSGSGSAAASSSSSGASLAPQVLSLQISYCNHDDVTDGPPSILLFRHGFPSEWNEMATNLSFLVPLHAVKNARGVECYELCDATRADAMMREPAKVSPKDKATFGIASSTIKVDAKAISYKLGEFLVCRGTCFDEDRVDALFLELKELVHPAFTMACLEVEYNPSTKSFTPRRRIMVMGAVVHINGNSYLITHTSRPFAVYPSTPTELLRTVRTCAQTTARLECDVVRSIKMGLNTLHATLRFEHGSTSGTARIFLEAKSVTPNATAATKNELPKQSSSKPAATSTAAAPPHAAAPPKSKAAAAPPPKAERAPDKKAASAIARAPVDDVITLDDDGAILQDAARAPSKPTPATVDSVISLPMAGNKIAPPPVPSASTAAAATVPNLLAMDLPAIATYEGTTAMLDAVRDEVAKSGILDAPSSTKPASRPDKFKAVLDAVAADQGVAVGTSTRAPTKPTAAATKPPTTVTGQKRHAELPIASDAPAAKRACADPVAAKTGDVAETNTSESSKEPSPVSPVATATTVAPPPPPRSRIPITSEAKARREKESAAAAATTTPPVASARPPLPPLPTSRPSPSISAAPAPAAPIPITPTTSAPSGPSSPNLVLMEKVRRLEAENAKLQARAREQEEHATRAAVEIAALKAKLESMDQKHRDETSGSDSLKVAAELKREYRAEIVKMEEEVVKVADAMATTLEGFNACFPSDQVIDSMMRFARMRNDHTAKTNDLARSVAAFKQRATSALKSDDARSTIQSTAPALLATISPAPPSSTPAPIASSSGRVQSRPPAPKVTTGWEVDGADCARDGAADA